MTDTPTSEQTLKTSLIGESVFAPTKRQWGVVRSMHYQPGSGPIAPMPGYGPPSVYGPPPRRRSSARLRSVVLGVFVTLVIALAATVGAGTRVPALLTSGAVTCSDGFGFRAFRCWQARACRGR